MIIKQLKQTRIKKVFLMISNKKNILQLAQRPLTFKYRFWREPNNRQKPVTIRQKAGNSVLTVPSGAGHGPSGTGHGELNWDSFG